MAGTLEVVQEELDAVQPYSMHVSSKYLELTNKKLQLTRLPRELELPEGRRWELGVPKSVLEPLLDYWLESYDWRTQEAHLNTALPQYRTTVPLPSQTPESSSSLRIHFVHKRSKHENAIPLLFCHTWPASFIEVTKIIDALTDPQSLPSFGVGAQQAFHVIAPSIPGFGFSDASPIEDFGLKETAQCFHAVMEKLGYEQYVTHGTGWGFEVCRSLAINHPKRCLAVHTANPTFMEPSFKRSPAAWAKYRIAKWTNAKIPTLSFGYTPSELQRTGAGALGERAQSKTNMTSPVGATLSPLYALRPQTLAFSLCDSPIGLLAGMLDVLHARSPSDSPPTSRSRSPFLSPSELELQDSGERRASMAENQDRSSSPGRQQDQPLSPRHTEAQIRSYSWSPTEILNWTMLTWLPGPEASLRWLRRATADSGPTTALSTTYCPVPLGISSFQRRGIGNSSNGTMSRGNPGSTPLMWGAAWWQIAWVKRHQRPASLSPAWEAPDLLVLDMRECFGTFVSNGSVNLPVREG